MLCGARGRGRPMPVARAALAAVGLFVSSACDLSAGSTRVVHVRVRVTADSGTPLSGVPVRVDDDVAGRTGSAGFLLVELSAATRREVRLEPVCPEGHRQPDGPSVVRLRSYSGKGARTNLEIELTCRRARRRAIFIVRAINAADIAVRLDGEVVARTNPDGIAHLSRSAAAGTEYLIELDASEHSNLLPRSTMRRFELPDRDEIFIVEQRFERDGMKRESRRHRRPRIFRIE